MIVSPDKSGYVGGDWRNCARTVSATRHADPSMLFDAEPIKHPRRWIHRGCLFLEALRDPDSSCLPLAVYAVSVSLTTFKQNGESIASIFSVHCFTLPILAA